MVSATGSFVPNKEDLLTTGTRRGGYEKTGL
jgi:hypothetical protein